MDNLEEMEKFSERYSLPRWNQEKIKNVNTPFTSTDFETVTEVLPKTSVQNLIASCVNFINHLEKS